jgi:hypothetical protein
MKTISVFGSIFVALILISSEARALEPLYDGVGVYTRKISTKSDEAQKYFDQGINFYLDLITLQPCERFKQRKRLTLTVP